MKQFFKYVFPLLLFSVILNVDASVKCNEGKPGDTISCVVNNAGHGGSISKIEVDEGLTFVSCDVCNDKSYNIVANKDATFKFKIDESITESKTLKASFAGENAKIKVVVATEDSDNSEEESTATIYSVTLVPGNGQSNKTKTCTVNSLNTTCNITLDEIDNENFTGWGKEKNCTEGAKGSVKVNKNITYYACYKSSNTENDNNENGNNTEITENESEISTSILLKSLIVKNGDNKIDLGFSIRKFEYTITVPTSVEKLDVTPTAQDDSVKIQVVGNNDLKLDNNVITINLTDENGKTNKYTINVIKSDEVSKPLLSSLTIGAYNIDFSPEKFNYNVKIDNRISSLNINAIPEDDSYEKVISGNANLENGSKINITITNTENNQSSTYVINIEKESNSLYIYIAVSVIVLIILIILLIVVVKKGKKKNNTNSNLNNKKVANKNLNGQVVNNQSNIPEVKPTVPISPVEPVNQNAVSNKDSIETLDL